MLCSSVSEFPRAWKETSKELLKQSSIMRITKTVGYSLGTGYGAPQTEASARRVNILASGRLWACSVQPALQLVMYK